MIVDDILCKPHVEIFCRHAVVRIFGYGEKNQVGKINGDVQDFTCT